MLNCSVCGERLIRTRRTFLEKPFFSLAFKCRGCDIRVREKHRFFYHFGRYVQCPHCGTTDLEKRSSRDKIDRLTKNPFSMVQALFGAHLYHCVFCRFQFYDLRSRKHRGVESTARVVL